MKALFTALTAVLISTPAIAARADAITACDGGRYCIPADYEPATWHAPGPPHPDAAATRARLRVQITVSDVIAVIAPSALEAQGFKKRSVSGGVLYSRVDCEGLTCRYQVGFQGRGLQTSNQVFVDSLTIMGLDETGLKAAQAALGVRSTPLGAMIALKDLP